ncbi:hypothetical protein LPB41_04835 [Thalassospira sp. MA62]|nr:hypothetical protein [Thalassospira sp. MA62]
MTETEGPSTAKRPPLTNFHKLALFGIGAVLCGTVVLMMTFSGVTDMMMRGRSGGGFMLTIGMTLAISLEIVGGTIIAKCVSKIIKPMLED